MDSDELRGFEEEVGRLWVEIPPGAEEGRHDIRHINRRYVLDPWGEVQVWYCRDSDGERFIVLAFRHTPYYYEWGERWEAWRIARRLALRERLLGRLIPQY